MNLTARSSSVSSPSIVSRRSTDSKKANFDTNPAVNRSSNESEDGYSEDSERAQWSNRFEFLLSVLGYAVGLGNVWRFPTLTYSNGGGAFLIPYTISLIFIGLPIFLLELSLGQFTSCGAMTCWEFCPVVRGLGVAMTMVGGLTSIFYNMIIGWAIYFFFASLTHEVPWIDCSNSWNTKDCIDTDFPEFLGKKCKELGGTWKDEKCSLNGTVVQPYNKTPVFPAAEYFDRYVLNTSAENDIENIGPVQNKLVGCLLLAWILIACVLIRGVRTSGKVVYVTALAPYFMLTILLFRGLYMAGAAGGIRWYLFSADVSRLSEAQIWKQAATQIFFSLSASMGGLMTLASYNDFKNNIVADAFVVAVGNSLTSIFAGFVIFAFLGGLAHIVDVDIGEVVKGGPTLVFGIYPMALTHLPGSQFWSLLFFLMVIFLGIDSQMVLVETVVTSLADSFKNLRRYRLRTLLGACTVFFLAGLPLTTRGGPHVIDFMDANAVGWNVLLIAVTECIAVSWFYGADRFLQDITTMIGTDLCKDLMFSEPSQNFFKISWTYITPALSMTICIFSWWGYRSSPILWVEVVGHILSGGGLFLGCFYSAHAVLETYGVSISEGIKNSFKPSIFWGPAHVDDRRLVQQYVPNLILAPLGEHQPGVYREDPMIKSLSSISRSTPSKLSISRPTPSKGSIIRPSPSEEYVSEKLPAKENTTQATPNTFQI